jgi:phage gp16-like protein
MSQTRTLQRLIHVGCKELGIDTDTRHDLQLILTGKASMSDMTELELRAMVDGLQARGFKPYGNTVSRGRKTPGKTPAHPIAPRADLRLVHVLWKRLGEAGALREPGRAGLNAFVRASFEGKWQSVPIDIDALREAGQIDDVVQALKAMCRRAGVKLK